MALREWRKVWFPFWLVLYQSCASGYKKVWPLGKWMTLRLSRLSERVQNKQRRSVWILSAKADKKKLTYLKKKQQKFCSLNFIIWFTSERAILQLNKMSTKWKNQIWIFLVLAQEIFRLTVRNSCCLPYVWNEHMKVSCEISPNQKVKFIPWVAMSQVVVHINQEVSEMCTSIGSKQRYGGV